ncbi:hypothetical protein EYF80_011579 [Liparis tanakae]|uniref:Uncharacterized protein n=1 Tax=Liparis tanakae TaxID=230148 RepID=A0A4Z2IKR0_9TELE|nr:hypothetical protein EYF80_011579 [Liparis tanakae]
MSAVVETETVLSDSSESAHSQMCTITRLVKTTLAMITCVEGDRLLATRPQETTCAQRRFVQMNNGLFIPDLHKRQ